MYSGIMGENVGSIINYLNAMSDLSHQECIVDTPSRVVNKSTDGVLGYRAPQAATE